MRRRRSSGSRSRIRSRSAPEGRAARPPSRREEVRRKAAIRERLAASVVGAPTVPLSTRRKGPERNRVRSGLRNRRTALRSRGDATKTGLPSAVLSLAKPDERSRRNSTKASSPCARKKTTRRSVILATGHGGINRVKKYAQHRRC